MTRPGERLVQTLTDEERGQLRSGWEAARSLIETKVFPKGFPDRVEEVLQDWYTIRQAFVLEGNIDRFMAQQRYFNKEYGKMIDKDEMVPVAVGLITAVLNRDVR